MNYLRDERPKERMAFRNEAFSFVTHSIGALAAVVGLYLLVTRAHGTAATTAVAIYGATLVAMFASSVAYHATRDHESEESVFRRLDMTAIYLFIAGTYTPVCVLALPRPMGLFALAGVWTLALIGIAIRWFAPVAPRWVTIALYLGMGWAGLGGAYYVVSVLSWGAFWLLLGGGLAYSVGALVYALEKPDPWPHAVGHHGIWHLFVLAGAGLHFALIWRYVPLG